LDGYLGTIMLIAFNWAPMNWALCQGQVMPISQSTALFSLLGPYFGGDGKTTFGLPDLRGRVPCGYGKGPLTQQRDFAQQFGADKATLTQNNLPPLPIREGQAGKTVSATAAATVKAKAAQGSVLMPSNSYWAYGWTGSTATKNYADSAATPDATMAADAVQVTVTPTFNVANLATGGTGAAQPFDLNPPSLALNYSICTAGLYPTRD